MFRKSTPRPDPDIARQPRLKLSVSSRVGVRLRTAIEEGLYALNVEATGIGDGCGMGADGSSVGCLATLPG